MYINNNLVDWNIYFFILLVDIDTINTMNGRYIHRSWTKMHGMLPLVYSTVGRYISRLYIYRITDSNTRPDKISFDNGLCCSYFLTVQCN